MRLALPVLLAAMIIAPVHAQSGADQWLVGPSFAPSAVQRDKYDAVFPVKVARAGVPVFRNQPADARYDAIVCNSGKTRGGARAELSRDWWSMLDPGLCTMFANVSQLELTPMEPGGEWTADIYLRAHR